MGLGVNRWQEYISLGKRDNKYNNLMVRRGMVNSRNQMKPRFRNRNHSRY